MGLFLFFLFVVVVVVLAILFLNRYYRKATREVALVRTGAGGQQVITDGGCLSLPFLHKISEVNMKTSRLEIERLGPKSIITSDRLRVDVGAEFYVRVDPTIEGVATAAQALAASSFRSSELADILEGKLVDAMLSVAATYTLDSLQDNRGKYSAEVSEILAPNLKLNGLLLESVSITRLDQTPFHALDENNAFNALGMRRLSEIIATNKKERAAIEAEADVAVLQSHLEATKRKLLIVQEEEEATIAQQLEIETARAQSMANVAEQQADSERRRESARIEREREVRRQSLESDLTIQTLKADNAVALAIKQIEESKAAVKAKSAAAEDAAAEEHVVTAKETAAAQRVKDIAVIKAQEEAAVDDTKVKSEAGTVVAMAEAEAKAVLEKAEATKSDLLARAEGTAAMVAAENGQSDELIQMKLDERRLRALPDVVEKLMKPTEKIESIRVNHITGLGGNSSSGGGETSGGNGVNQVVDGVLGLALQLPAVKKLGEEVGMNIAGGMEGLTGPLASKSKNDETPKED